MLFLSKATYIILQLFWFRGLNLLSNTSFYSTLDLSLHEIMTLLPILCGYWASVRT